MAEPVEVFVRAAPRNSIRRLMLELMMERVIMEPDVTTVLILPRDVPCPASLLACLRIVVHEEDFAWESRYVADKMAQGSSYFLIDDDALPIGPLGWFRDFRALCEKDGQFDFVSAGRAIGVEDVVGRTQFPIVDNIGVGAPYWQKKGIIPYVELEGPPNRQDTVVHEWIRAHGLRDGITQKFKVNHLGYGFSQVEPKLWLRY